MDSTVEASTSASASALPSGGQYFIDQATGQYYYQSQDGETMTVVQSADVEGQQQPPQQQEEDTNQVGKEHNFRLSFMFFFLIISLTAVVFPLERSFYFLFFLSYCLI